MAPVKKKLAIVGEMCYIVFGDEGCADLRRPSFAFLRETESRPPIKKSERFSLRPFAVRQGNAACRCVVRPCRKGEMI